MHFKCILLPNEPIATGAASTSPAGQHHNEPIASGASPSPPAGQQKPGSHLKLWGLTLGMTLDLLSSMSLPTDAAAAKASTKNGDLSTYPHAVAALPQEKGVLFAPSMASIFPRFVCRLMVKSFEIARADFRSQSYPDINALIYVFGRRYRRTLNQSPTESARVNWAGMSIGSYYAAVRRALVVAVVLRALTALGGIGWLVFELRKRMQSRKVAKALGLR